MNITILGGGAMGSLFGGYLSKKNSVTIVDLSEKIVDAIEEKGVSIKEKDGSVSIYKPKAVTDSSLLPVQDLVIVFVKSMYTVSALEKNRNLIGKDTYLMTLQNGAGHERKLLKFADRKHVIIGSTQHNSSLIEPGSVNHGGSGMTSIGLLDGNSISLNAVCDTFTASGLECRTEENVQKQIWKKMFTNTAASSLTALFQVPLGFIHSDRNASSIMHTLAEEAVTVANALGLDFNLDEVIEDIEKVLIGAPDGYTSIYADIRDGRKTEVDTISGSVVEAAHELKIAVPYHEMLVLSIHALENKSQFISRTEK